LHFFEFFQRGNSGAQPVGLDAIKGPEILAVEDYDIQAVKMAESVNEPKSRVLERSRRAESCAEFDQGLKSGFCSTRIVRFTLHIDSPTPFQTSEHPDAAAIVPLGCMREQVFLTEDR
jgi:hypothetical protein